MKKLIKKIQNRILKFISFDSCSAEYDKFDPWFKCERSIIDGDVYVDRISNYKIDYPYLDKVMIQDFDNKNCYRSDDWEGRKVLARVYGIAKARLSLLNSEESRIDKEFYIEAQKSFSGITWLTFRSESIEVSWRIKQFISLLNHQHTNSYKIYTQRKALEKLMKEIDIELGWKK